MKDLLSSSLFYGVLISLLGYEVGLFLKKKLHNPVFNPLLISIIFVMAVLLIFGVDYESYNDGAKYLSYLLTPATVCLAIPLYQQLEMLKNNIKAILAGIFSGMLTSLVSVLLLALLFHFNHEQYVTLLPKSITTAIGMGVSEELGGIVTITVAVIIITGVLGNIMAETICKIFHIKDPVAKGIAIGTSSHAIGTVKAMEMGEIEGAMSSLAIVVCGLFTVIGASIFANFM
jgi:predicted murein hydrolase (TIGR00659 family)